MSRDEIDFAVVDLFVRAGLISQAQRDEAITVADRKHLHPGQTLIIAGYVSPRELQAAIDALSILRDYRIDDDLAQRCLKIASQTGQGFMDVLADQLDLQAPGALLEWLNGNSKT
jgi:hypothetical protein